MQMCLFFFFMHTHILICVTGIFAYGYSVAVDFFVKKVIID